MWEALCCRNGTLPDNSCHYTADALRLIRGVQPYLQESVESLHGGIEKTSMLGLSKGGFFRGIRLHKG
jgi:hypothetical protein